MSGELDRRISDALRRRADDARIDLIDWDPADPDARIGRRIRRRLVGLAGAVLLLAAAGVLMAECGDQAGSDGASVPGGADPAATTSVQGADPVS